jgi:hypothetical protein
LASVAGFDETGAYSSGREKQEVFPAASMDGFRASRTVSGGPVILASLPRSISNYVSIALQMSFPKKDL